MEVAGNTCTPWSSRGSRQRWLDPHSVTNLIWMYSVRAAKPHYIVNECVPAFDAQVLETVFDQYHLSSWVLNPLMLGLPASRGRRYTLLCHKPMVDMVLHVDLDTFGSLAFCTLASDGSMFLRASAEEEKSFMDALAAVRRIAPRLDGNSHHCRFVISVADRARLQLFERVIAADPKYADQPVLFFDITQNACKRPNITATMPCLLRRSAMWCSSKQRLVLPSELLLVQGLPFTLDDSDEFSTFAPWPAEVTMAWGPAALRSMSGNSMSLPVVGRVMLFLLLATRVTEGPSGK